MAYHQITSEERYWISALRRQGLNQAQIARSVGRHRSSISRELHRNSSSWDGGYRPFVASHRARARLSRSRRRNHFTRQDLEVVESLLKRKWSPEQISGHLGRERLLSISHETIYRHVWSNRHQGGNLHRHLRCAVKQRRKRHNSNDSRGRLAGKRHISERPAAVETRRRIGHWEIDTVVGASTKDCVVTLVERKTGYVFIGKLAARSMYEMSRRVRMLMRRAIGRFETITADNGTEFHDYASIEAATGIRFYFATPYHSWERGSNENFNGLLRQYLPKRTSMAHVTQRQCDTIAHKLNARPRKRLQYRTPEECFNEC